MELGLSCVGHSGLQVTEEGQRLGGVDELSWQNQLRAEHRLRCSLSSLKEALMPSITQGRWSCQSAAAARDRKASFSRLWNRSTNLFD
jgi:hypothetical protein